MGIVEKTANPQRELSSACGSYNRTVFIKTKKKVIIPPIKNLVYTALICYYIVDIVKIEVGAV